MNEHTGKFSGEYDKTSILAKYRGTGTDPFQQEWGEWMGEGGSKSREISRVLNSAFSGRSTRKNKTITKTTQNTKHKQKNQKHLKVSM